MIRVLVPQQFYSAFGFSVISQIHTEKSVIIRVICERSLLNIGCLDNHQPKNQIDANVAGSTLIAEIILITILSTQKGLWPLQMIFIDH